MNLWRGREGKHFIKKKIGKYRWNYLLFPFVTFLADPLFRHEFKTMNSKRQEVIQVRYPHARDHDILPYFM